jgi:hypothetical protein
MMPRMNNLPQNGAEPDIELLEKLYKGGDYKQARETARRLATSSNLSKDEQIRVDKIAASMRTDKAAIAAFAFTFFVLVYLVVKFGM